MIAVFLFVAQMSCPDHQAHAMGFSQETTKHTFRLFSDGGAIEVRAKDDATLKLVREHLRVIAKSFAAGDFSKPQEVHDRLPDGAAKMKELRSEITYRYNDLPSGGQVRIKTKIAGLNGEGSTNYTWQKNRRRLDQDWERSSGDEQPIGRMREKPIERNG